MNLLIQIDSAISTGLLFLLKLSGHIALLLSGATYLILHGYWVFEYGEGLYDLSLLEIIGFLLFAALIYRHIKHCNRFGVKLWHRLSRPFYSFGWLFCLTALPEAAYFVIQKELGRPLYVLDTPEVQAIFWLLTLFALYISTPCKLAQKNGLETESSSPAEQRVAPTLNEVEDAVSTTKETPTPAASGNCERVAKHNYSVEQGAGA